MRFATIRTAAGTTAARLDGDILVPLDAPDVGALLASGGLMSAPATVGAAPVPAASADFAPVVTGPSKILCAGLNYRSHIQETGRELPEYPTLFAKFAETLMGPNDDLAIPAFEDAVRRAFADASIRPALSLSWRVRLGITPAQVALQWLLELAPNVLLIPGTGSVAHLRENLAAESVTPDDQALRRLDGVGARLRQSRVSL